jgi:hypothetical protein
MTDLKSMIEEALYEHEDTKIDNDEEPLFEDIEDLRQSEYLTDDEGLVVKLVNGKKFIIRIQEV